MKVKVLAGFIILILVTVGIMGFFSMDMMSQDNQTPCPFSLSGGGNCSLLDNSLMALHHLSGVEYFSQVIVATDFGLFIFFSFFLFFLPALLIKFIEDTLPGKIFYKKIHIAKIKYKYKRSFLRWLSLTRYRDSLPVNRVCSFA